MKRESSKADNFIIFANETLIKIEEKSGEQYSSLMQFNSCCAALVDLLRSKFSSFDSKQEVRRVGRGKFHDAVNNLFLNFVSAQRVVKSGVLN